jgi:hypothetical protein
MLMAAPRDAANPTKNALSGRPAAAKMGARVETAPQSLSIESALIG